MIRQSYILGRTAVKLAGIAALCIACGTAEKETPTSTPTPGNAGNFKCDPACLTKAPTLTRNGDTYTLAFEVDKSVPNATITFESISTTNQLPSSIAITANSTLVTGSNSFDYTLVPSDQMGTYYPQFVFNGANNGSVVIYSRDTSMTGGKDVYLGSSSSGAGSVGGTTTTSFVPPKLVIQ